MTKKVLILSSREDPHAAGVAECLEQLGTRPDFLLYDELLSADVQLHYADGPDRRIIELNDRRLNLATYDSVWHRRPGRVLSPQFVEPWIAEMVRQETTAMIHGLWQSLSCLWVNYPPNDSVCLQKLTQLYRATKLGFNIPPTIVTNQPDVVRDFYKRCGGSVVYKMISEHSSGHIPATEMPAGIPTLPLRNVDLKFLQQVEFAPHMFQKCIEKKYELRVTVVGKQVFAIKIESQTGRGKIDWRNDYSVEMVPYELPARQENLCLELTRAFGLNYSAIDMIVSQSNDYFFVEINCAGQFKWIEARTKLNISLELAKLLIGKSPPLSKTGLIVH